MQSPCESNVVFRYELFQSYGVFRRRRSGQKPPNILDQGESQHDGDAPQFPKLQDAHRLVGVKNTHEISWIRMPIAVRDYLQAMPCMARKPGQGSVQQHRQFPTVPLGQVLPSYSNLFLDQIEVVEQLFFGRRNPALGLNGLR